MKNACMIAYIAMASLEDYRAICSIISVVGFKAYIASHVAEMEVVSMEKQRKEVMVQPLLLNIPEVCKSLRLSRAKVYDLISFEGLPVVRFGRAVRVPHASLQQWIDQRMKSA